MQKDRNMSIQKSKHKAPLIADVDGPKVRMELWNWPMDGTLPGCKPSPDWQREEVL